MTHAPSQAQLQEVAARFGKQADFTSLLPMVAGPALGAYFGKSIGGRMGRPDLGQLLGGISGGIGGGLMRENLQERQQPAQQPQYAMPPGAPYALDPTDMDIPSWALAGTPMFRQAIKQSSESEGAIDNALSDVAGPVYPAIQGFRQNGWAGAGKHVLGATGGTLAGGALGYGAGQLLNHFGINPHLLGVSLPTMLSGLGATIGNAKGFQWAKGSGH